MKITRAWWFFLTAYFSFSVVNCPQLTTPPKAVLLTVPCTSTYGSNCSYSCQTGYTSLTGNVTRTCLSSGNWSGSDIRCTGNYSHIKCVFNFMTSVTFNVPSQAHVSRVRLAFLLITKLLVNLWGRLLRMINLVFVLSSPSQITDYPATLFAG